MYAAISLVLAVFFFFPSAIAFGAGNLTDQLFIGAESLARGRFELAGQAFTQALAMDPDNAYAKSRLALTLAAEGQTDKARAELEKALASRGDDLFALWTLGCLDLLAGQPATAEARFAAMRKADPGNARGTLGMGLAALLSGRTAAGVTLLGEAQAAESQAPLDRFLAGLAYFLLDAPANARLELEATLELEPRNTAALELLGLVYRRQGKANLAKNAWEQALAIDPKQSGARFFLSRLAEDEGLAASLAEQPEEARRAYARALSLDPGNEAAAKALGVPSVRATPPGDAPPAGSQKVAPPAGRPKRTPPAGRPKGAPPAGSPKGALPLLDFPAGGDNPPRTPLPVGKSQKGSGAKRAGKNVEEKKAGQAGSESAAPAQEGVPAKTDAAAPGAPVSAGDRH